MTKRTAITLGCAAVAVAGGVLAFSTLSVRSADDDKGIVSNLLSRALSTPASRVSIGTVQGALSSDSTINDISIADRDGVWLQIDRVRLNWTRSALLFGNLQIDKLEIGTVRYLRKALPNEQPNAVSDEPILPELPVKLEIKDFALKELAFGAPVFGQAASLGATGNARLGKPSEGLNLIFDARRLDAQGTLTARLELVPTTQRLSLKLGVDEPANGIAANALNIPGRPPVKLDLDGRGTLDSFDAQLAFDAGAGIGANGSAQVRRTADVRRLALNMAARIEGLLPPVAAPVFAGTTQLSGNVGFADSGAVTVSPLTVMSQTARLDINGTVSAAQVADLKIAARALPNAGNKTAAQGTEIGVLAFDGSVTGPIAGPAIKGTLDAQRIVTPQGKVDRVAAKFDVTPSGAVTEKTTAIPFNADVQVRGIAAADPSVARVVGSTLDAALTGRWNDGYADVQTARLQTATAQARFAGRVGAKQLQGKLDANLPDLAKFGMNGALTLNADVSGVPNENRIDTKAVAQLTSQRARLALNVDATDVLGVTDARTTLSGTVGNKPAQGALRVAKRANEAWLVDDLNLRIGSAAISGAGTLNAERLADGNLKIDIANLDDLSPLVLNKLAGQLRADATFSAVNGGQNTSVNAQARGVRLDFASLERLDAKLNGTDLYRRAGGNWTLTANNVVAPQARDAGLPALDINASGQLAENRTSVDGAINAKGAGDIRVTGNVPFKGDGLDLRARGKINIGVSDRFLAQSGRRLAGSADIDVRATGALAKPSLDGAATINGATYSDVVLGLRYTGISGRVSARGNDVVIERMSAQTPNGGTINANGTVAINADAGFPGTIRINANRAKLVENDIYSLVANANVALSGALARSPAISGSIDVISLDVTVPERLPGTLSPLDGTRHVKPTPAAQQRIAAAARANARAQRGPAFDATLDLTISAPNRVFVRGRGIDSELGGSLRLRGKLSDPVTDGAFELRRGRISVAGTRLDFTQGRVLFTGDLSPTLDFVAQTRTADVTAIVAVSGSARQPDFTFSSQPDLPQDEVLSRILFSKASGGLSAIQALQLAQVAAQFSGGGGNDVFEKVRKSLGVDSLDVSTGTSGNPTVGISRSLGRRLSVGVKTGSEARDSGVSVDLDVTRNLRLKGEANADGGTAVGAGVEWEFE